MRVGKQLQRVERPVGFYSKALIITDRRWLSLINVGWLFSSFTRELENKFRLHIFKLDQSPSGAASVTWIWALYLKPLKNYHVCTLERMDARRRKEQIRPRMEAQINKSQEPLILSVLKERFIYSKIDLNWGTAFNLKYIQLKSYIFQLETFNMLKFLAWGRHVWRTPLVSRFGIWLISFISRYSSFGRNRNAASVLK